MPVHAQDEAYGPRDGLPKGTIYKRLAPNGPNYLYTFPEGFNFSTRSPVTKITIPGGASHISIPPDAVIQIYPSDLELLPSSHRSGTGQGRKRKRDVTIPRYGLRSSGPLADKSDSVGPGINGYSEQIVEERNARSEEVMEEEVVEEEVVEEGEFVEEEFVEIEVEEGEIIDEECAAKEELIIKTEFKDNGMPLMWTSIAPFAPAIKTEQER